MPVSGLSQIMNVPIRENSILDWCLTNFKNSVFIPVQLPQIGSTDHNAILIKSHLSMSQTTINSPIYKRDLRDSRLRKLGCYISSFDWSEVTEISSCERKYQRFNEILGNMIDRFLPIKANKISQSDKPWMMSALKLSINARQKLLHKLGKSSQMFKFWCNKVQADVKTACNKYYSFSVKKLRGKTIQVVEGS